MLSSEVFSLDRLAWKKRIGELSQRGQMKEESNLVAAGNAIDLAGGDVVGGADGRHDDDKKLAGWVELS